MRVCQDRFSNLTKWLLRGYHQHSEKQGRNHHESQKADKTVA